MKSNTRTGRATAISRRGFTLFELVIVLLITAVLVAWSFPSLQQSIQNNRVIAHNSSLIALLHFARTESIRRNQSVTVSFTTNANGWGLVVEDPNNEIEVEGCVPGQLRCINYTGTLLSLEVDELIFNNRGYISDGEEPWTSETIFLQHQHCNGNNQRTRVDISPTGQVTSCTLSCYDTSECPL